MNGTLRFLALENALLNQGGYRATGGGYGLYLDPSGRFHLVPLAGAASFRLVETQVVATGFRRRPGAGESRDRPRPAAGSPGATANVAAKTSGPPARQTPSAAPRPASTDLAMMLSYSLVLKADRDDDQSVTRDEWLDFARGWFTVMDENYAGQVTRAQFIEKFRWFVTPPSMRDGKSRQTYGKDDPAEIIGDEFFAEMDQDRDGNVAREEFAGAFARWFDRWGDARTHRLAQGQIQAGLEKLIADHVFTADPVEIAKRDKFIVNDDPRDAGRSGDEAGRDERGGGRGAGGGSGLSVGLPIPGLRLGTDSFRRRSEGGSGGGRTLVTQREQLEVLAGMDDPRRALLNKLFDAPGLRWRYLGYLHDVAQRWLAWDRVGEIAKRYQALLADEVRRDTHKPDSYEHFVQHIDQDETDADNDEPSLKKIVTDRQRYVLDDEAVQRHADGK
ncbi:hypothetical protein [Oleiharenicola sp. Vm1]|uniref:hypothetical protein n=1 Tax=Oleiharenicola sp. Vm1 TaxID=3398393 RepID=UPI0039F45053